MRTSNLQAERPARPQNKCYPAGGTIKSDAENKLEPCQRGVIVAPPSGNTSDPDEPMVLHKGFDTLALAVKAKIPSELFDCLEAERHVAENERRDVLVTYNGIKLLLSPYGGNGYKFIANGGPDGATWFFKKPNAKDPWGIRLSFGSFFMANHGIGAAKAHVDHVLGRLGVRFGPDDISISRVDFCVDVLVPSFSLDPDRFVMHSAARRRDHFTSDDMAVSGKSGRVTSVTIGGTRNRQVIVYDKRAEVITHRKSYWWDIWNHTLRTEEEATIPYIGVHRELLSPDPDKAEENRVWRVEFRAGKNLLKDRWGIRTWAQLFDRFGDLCREAGEVVRYADPVASDPNRSRWPNHMLWEIVCAEMNDDLTEMRSSADPKPMKEVHREEHIRLIYKNLLGSSITLAALRDQEHDGLAKVFETISGDMIADVISNPVRSAKQLQDAKDRYVFIRRPDNATDRK